MASATTTATVETLTAEVRVLAVGNRQITLSVAKQLDCVPLDELTVFGRVNLGASARSDLVIGAHTSGALALAAHSEFRKPYNWRAVLTVPDEWPESERPEVGWAIQADRDGYYQLSFSDHGGIPVEIDSRECRVRDGHDKYQEARNRWITEVAQHGGTVGEPKPKDYGGHLWTPGPHHAELLAQAERQLAQVEQRHKRHEAAKDAPLIVLAGLK